MNQIAVVSMVKNEEDIIESSVRHWAIFADTIFICDHKSTDRTREILESLKDEGLPIEISTFDRDEKAQAEVTNKLIKRAFAEGFDIILPLDADEFPIYRDGDSHDLRRYLQSHDIDQFYRVYMWEYRFNDKDESRFALSRSILRTKDHSIGHKIFIGREFWMNHDLEIIQGNHGFEFLTEYLIQPAPNDEIIYAHFSQRSPEQLLSKTITNHLNNRLLSTRYTMFSSIGIHPDFDNIQSEIDLEEFEPADLSVYRDEAVNKFSGGGASTLYAIYSTSQTT